MLIPATVFAREKTDVIITANGDRLTCEVKRLEAGVLYASLNYVDGTISIEWSIVVRLESKQPLHSANREWRNVFRNVEDAGRLARPTTQDRGCGK
jgi:hypothetical protein